MFLPLFPLFLWCAVLFWFILPTICDQLYNLLRSVQSSVSLILRGPSLQLYCSRGMALDSGVAKRFVKFVQFDVNSGFGFMLVKVLTSMMALFGTAN